MKASAGRPSHLAGAAHALICFPACFLLFVTIKQPQCLQEEEIDLWLKHEGGDRVNSRQTSSDVGVRGDAAGTEQVLPVLNQLQWSCFLCLHEKKSTKLIFTNQIHLNLFWLILAVPIFHNFFQIIRIVHRCCAGIIDSCTALLRQDAHHFMIYRAERHSQCIHATSYSSFIKPREGSGRKAGCPGDESSPQLFLFLWGNGTMGSGIQWFYPYCSRQVNSSADISQTFYCFSTI